MSSRFAAVFFISLASLIIYSNTLTSPFHFDDIPNIVENEKIRDISTFLDISATRYVGDLSFALNYHFGRLHVTGYHIVNIAVHIANGILVWMFVVLTLRTPAMEMYGLDERVRGFIALSSSMLFTVHPLQTQAVSYIIQRYTSLAVFFCLLSMVLFVRWRLSSGRDSGILFYLFSIVSIVLAMKTKEISFTLPVVMLLYEYCFFRERRRIFYYFIPVFLTMLIIPVTLLEWDSRQAGLFDSLMEASQETAKISRVDYLLTQFRVIVTYLRLLFLPVNQNLDYDYPIYTTLFTPAVLLSFLFLFAMSASAIYFILRSRKYGNAYLQLSSFGIVWFFVTLSVESSIIPIKDVIFEHRLYMPGIGIMVAFSSAAAWVIESVRKRLSGMNSSVPVIVLLLIVLPLSFATYRRNQVWRDDISLWTDVVGKSPEKGRGYDNLGVAYFQQGKISEAIKAYQTAVRLTPDSHDAHYDLAVAYNRQGRFEDAVDEFNAALKLQPGIAEIHYNLGLVYFLHGQTGNAIKKLTDALQLKPGHAGIHYSLGNAYAREGKTDKAVEHYTTALRLQPGHLGANNSLNLLNELKYSR